MAPTATRTQRREWSPFHRVAEAVQEFQIITTNYAPEYGRASGGREGGEHYYPFRLE